MDKETLLLILKAYSVNDFLIFIKEFSKKELNSVLDFCIKNKKYDFIQFLEGADFINYFGQNPLIDKEIWPLIKIDQMANFINYFLTYGKYPDLKLLEKAVEYKNYINKEKLLYYILETDININRNSKFVENILYSFQYERKLIIKYEKTRFFSILLYNCNKYYKWPYGQDFRINKVYKKKTMIILLFNKVFNKTILYHLYKFL